VLADTVKIIAWVLAVLGGLSALVTLGFVRSTAMKEFIIEHTQHVMGVRYDRHWTTDDINKAISAAKNRVWILQTWIPTLSRDISHWKPLDRNVTFQVLLGADNIITARLKYRPRAVPLRDQNRTILDDFITDVKSGEVRLYTGLPFGPVYIVDDRIFWGIYLANTDSMKGPRFRCSTKSDMGKMIVNAFEFMWSSEAPLTDGAKRTESPSANNNGVGRAPHQPYQRNCSYCGTWLSYRPQSSTYSSKLESFCPNSDCIRVGERVEDVHVS